MKNTFLIFLVMASMARADLKFEFVDTNHVGIGKTLKEHKSAANARGKTTWLWGSLAWTDPSGSYAYFAFHGYGDGFLFKRNKDGSYNDISPTPPDDNTSLPTENRPILVDIDRNGYLDIIHTGDETPKGASLLNHGDGRWTFSRVHRLPAGGELVDVNNDGYPDFVSYRGPNVNYPLGSVRTATNLSGNGFKFDITPMILPDGCPREVVNRVTKANDRFHRTRVHHLDEVTYIVTYGGSYGGEKFTYTIRNNLLVDIGLPQQGMALKPRDVDGNGLLDVIIQNSKDAGVYRQNESGQFVLDTSGDMPKINVELREGSYAWDVWAVDLDQDGDLDLVLSGKRLGRGYILDNREGIYSLIETVHHVDGEAMWLGDVDGDGDIDIIVAGGGKSAGSPRDSDKAAFYINQLVSTKVR